MLTPLETRSYPVCLIGVVAAVLMGALSSVADGDDVAAARLYDMVVVATRHERAVADTPYHTFILDSETLTLQLQPRSLVEGLAAVPGVMLQKTGHGMTTPYMRGVTSQRVLLLADGVRLNNSYLREGPNQYWNLVDGYFYDHLEVLLGPASTLYGSDAIGGVVHAGSAPPVRGPSDAGITFTESEMLFRFASAERSFTEHAETAFTAADRWSFRIGLTRQDFGDLRSGDETYNPGTDFEQWGANLRAVYWIDNDSRVTVGYDHFDQDDIDRVHRTVDHVDFRGTSTKGGAGDRRRVFDHDRRVAFVRWELEDTGRFIDNADIVVSYSGFEEDFQRIRGDNRRQLRETEYDTSNVSITLRSLTRFGTWSYGLDHTHDFVNTSGRDVSTAGSTTERIQGFVGDNSDYDLLGLFVQNEKQLNDSLDVIAGVRYTYADLESRDVDFGGVPGRVRGNWDTVTGNLRLMLRLCDDDKANVFAGVSQGFRAPNLSDATRLGEFGGGNEAPTADLDPEYFTTYEAGVKSVGDWWSAGVGYFYTDISDRIGRLQNATTNAADPLATKRNLDNGYIHGLESYAEWIVNDQVSVHGSISWQEGAEETHLNRDLGTMVTVTRPIAKIQPLTGHAEIRWTPNAFFWSALSADAAAEQDRLADAEVTDNRIPPGGTPGYAVYHVQVGFRPSASTAMAVTLQNITDKPYRIHGSGINEPGRSLVLTVRKTF